MCVLPTIKNDKHSGRQMYKDRSKSSPVKNGVFLYDCLYYITTNRQNYGRVEKIPLPNFDSLDWSLPS